MDKSLFFLVIIASIYSCNNQSNESGDATAAKDSPLHCYRYIKDHDTITLKTIAVGSAITGGLVYSFFEKDKNMGTIQGYMKQDILIADYTFLSEGQQSVKQVAFKKTGSGFLEGYGAIQENDGRTTFKNIDSLDFSHGMVLTEYDCENKN